MADAPFHHVSVLKEETIQALLPDPALQNRIREEGRPLRVVDCTLGGGGHAASLIARLPAALPVEFYGFDRDPAALAAAEPRLRASIAASSSAGTVCATTMRLVNLPFSQGPSVVAGDIDLLLADLGVSSPQLDDAGRGFSLLRDGPLDMRMGEGCPQSAREILASWDEKELARIFKDYGEEPKARVFAQRLVQDRAAGKLPLESSVAFAEYAAQSLHYHRSRVHPATRIFQALRIAVNDELGELGALLGQLPSRLSAGGRAAFITFHSLEDRMVKQAMRAWEKGRMPDDGREDSDDGSLFGLPPQTISWGREDPRGGVAPAESEITGNPRSRSARLRCFAFSGMAPAERETAKTTASRKRR